MQFCPELAFNFMNLSRREDVRNAESLDSLLPELQIYISSYLPVMDACSFSLVSRKMSHIAGNHPFWSKLCKRVEIYPKAEETCREKFTSLLSHRVNNYAKWVLYLSKTCNRSEGYDQFLDNAKKFLCSSEISGGCKERVLLKYFRISVFDVAIYDLHPINGPEECIAGSPIANEHFANQLLLPFTHISDKFNQMILFYKQFKSVFESILQAPSDAILVNRRNIEIFKNICKSFKDIGDHKMAARADLALGICHYYLSFTEQQRLEKESACDYFIKVYNNPEASRRDKNYARFFELSLHFQGLCKHYDNESPSEIFYKLQNLKEDLKLPPELRGWIIIRQAILQYENPFGIIDDEVAFNWLSEASLNYGFSAFDGFRYIYQALFLVSGRIVNDMSFDWDFKDVIQSIPQDYYLAGKAKALAQFANACFQILFSDEDNDALVRNQFQTIVSEGHLLGRKEEQIAREYLAGQYSDSTSDSEDSLCAEEILNEIPERFMSCISLFLLPP